MLALTFSGDHKMEKIIHDVQSQEVTSVALTSAEVAAITKQQAEAAEAEAAEAQAQATKAAAKAALLAKLGINEDEAKLLLS